MAAKRATTVLGKGEFTVIRTLKSSAALALIVLVLLAALALVDRSRQRSRASDESLAATSLVLTVGDDCDEGAERTRTDRRLPSGRFGPTLTR